MRTVSCSVGPASPPSTTTNTLPSPPMDRGRECCWTGPWTVVAPELNIPSRRLPLPTRDCGLIWCGLFVGDAGPNVCTLNLVRELTGRGPTLSLLKVNIKLGRIQFAFINPASFINCFAIYVALPLMLL